MRAVFQLMVSIQDVMTWRSARVSGVSDRDAFLDVIAEAFADTGVGLSESALRSQFAKSFKDAIYDSKTQETGRRRPRPESSQLRR